MKNILNRSIFLIFMAAILANSFVVLPWLVTFTTVLYWLYVLSLTVAIVFGVVSLFKLSDPEILGAADFSKVSFTSAYTWVSSAVGFVVFIYVGWVFPAILLVTTVAMLLSIESLIEANILKQKLVV